MEIKPDDFKELRVCDPADGTILDILNADCWRIILDNVSINDVVRSERVSRAWQQVVRDYLAGVHNYRIRNLNHFNHTFCKRYCKRYWNYHSIKHFGHENLFEEMIQKIGSSFVKIVADYVNESHLKAISLHCPNLESLTLSRTYRNLPLDHVKKCKQLKQIVFDSCGLREDYLSEMITSETVEELIINNGSHVTGRFLGSLKKYLKSLGLNRCDYLQFKYLQSAENYLTKLTRLELNKNSPEILENIHLMLDRMPALESLSLIQYSIMDLDDKLPAAIGRLSRLKEIQLLVNENVTDEWLASIARGCPALRTVNVGCTSVTGRGLLALCRARPALEELMVAGLGVTDADLEACALCCGGLRLLDADECTQLTKRLPELIERPRARPLLLRLGLFLMDIKGTHYEGLALRWKDPRAYPYYMSYSNVTDSDSNSDDNYNSYG